MNPDRDTTHIYQAFHFDPEIKTRFYAGNSFLHYDESMSADELISLAGDILADGEDGFMPKLTKKIEELLGDGNYINDFWEFGPDRISLYWWIRRDVYLKKLQLIREWIAYEGLEKWCWFDEKEISE